MSDRLLITLVGLAFVVAAIPIALGFILGAVVWGLVVGWQFAKRAIIAPPPPQVEEDNDETI